MVITEDISTNKGTSSVHENPHSFDTTAINNLESNVFISNKVNGEVTGQSGSVVPCDTNDKKSFHITSVTVQRNSTDGNADESADESRTEESDNIDMSAVDVEAENFRFPDNLIRKDDVLYKVTSVGSAPIIPTSAQYGIAVVSNPNSDLPDVNKLVSNDKSNDSSVRNDFMQNGVENSCSINAPNSRVTKEFNAKNERFRVVKIESNEPFKRGRWVCMDFLDQSMDQAKKAAVVLNENDKNNKKDVDKETPTSDIVVNGVLNAENMMSGDKSQLKTVNETENKSTPLAQATDTSATHLNGDISSSVSPSQTYNTPFVPSVTQPQAQSLTHIIIPQGSQGQVTSGSYGHSQSLPQSDLQHVHQSAAPPQQPVHVVGSLQQSSFHPMQHPPGLLSQSTVPISNIQHVPTQQQQQQTEVFNQSQQQPPVSMQQSVLQQQYQTINQSGMNPNSQPRIATSQPHSVSTQPQPISNPHCMSQMTPPLPNQPTMPSNSNESSITQQQSTQTVPPGNQQQNMPQFQQNQPSGQQSLQHSIQQIPIQQQQPPTFQHQAGQQTAQQIIHPPVQQLPSQHHSQQSNQPPILQTNVPHLTSQQSVTQPAVQPSIPFMAQQQSSLQQSVIQQPTSQASTPQVLSQPVQPQQIMSQQMQPNSDQQLHMPLHQQQQILPQQIPAQLSQQQSQQMQQSQPLPSHQPQMQHIPQQPIPPQQQQPPPSQQQQSQQIPPQPQVTPQPQQMSQPQQTQHIPSQQMQMQQPQMQQQSQGSQQQIPQHHQPVMQVPQQQQPQQMLQTQNIQQASLQHQAAAYQNSQQQNLSQPNQQQSQTGQAPMQPSAQGIQHVQQQQIPPMQQSLPQQHTIQPKSGSLPQPIPSAQSMQHTMSHTSVPQSQPIPPSQSINNNPPLQQPYPQPSVVHQSAPLNDQSIPASTSQNAYQHEVLHLNQTDMMMPSNPVQGQYSLSQPQNVSVPSQIPLHVSMQQTYQNPVPPNFVNSSGLNLVSTSISNLPTPPISQQQQFYSHAVSQSVPQQTYSQATSSVSSQDLQHLCTHPHQVMSTMSQAPQNTSVSSHTMQSTMPGAGGCSQPSTQSLNTNLGLQSQIPYSIHSQNMYQQSGVVTSQTSAHVHTQTIPISQPSSSADNVLAQQQYNLPRSVPSTLYGTYVNPLHSVHVQQQNYVHGIVRPAQISSNAPNPSNVTFTDSGSVEQYGQPSSHFPEHVPDGVKTVSTAEDAER